MQQNLYDTGQQKDIQAVRAHYWWCGRKQRSRARPMIRGIEHLQVKTRLKGPQATLQLPQQETNLFCCFCFLVLLDFGFFF